MSGDLEDALDLYGGVGWKDRHTDRRTGATAFVSEHRHHEVGGAIHHLGTLEKGRVGIDEAAETNDLLHVVEIAERSPDLRQQIDRAGACRLLAVLDRHAASELAFGHHIAAG